MIHIEDNLTQVKLGKENKENELKASHILKRRLMILADRVEALEWAMKYVLDKTQQMDPVSGKACFQEPQRKSSESTHEVALEEIE